MVKIAINCMGKKLGNHTSSLYRPFLLPCLAVASISAAAFASSLFFLQETLPAKAPGQYTALKSKESEMAALGSHTEDKDEEPVPQSPGDALMLTVACNGTIIRS